MEFIRQLLPAVLIRRYKRFLADVELEDGKVMTVHCPNSGSMLGCNTPGSRVMLSRSDNVKRKHSHTLEMVKAGGHWVGVNTGLTNRLVAEALGRGIISEFGPIDHMQREVKTSSHTRLDFFLQSGGRKIYMEVKNCSLVENGVAMFPDAITTRGTKHLLELLALKRAGAEAAVLFCVQRQDGHCFAPAAHIDPHYAETLAMVRAAGVMVLAYAARVSPRGVKIISSLPMAIEFALPSSCSRP
jgi:sugar fermentation stimulation protein A